MYASSSGDGQRSGWRKRQILDMAEKASQSKQDWWKDDDALEAFAKLVREYERDQVTQLLYKMHERAATQHNYYKHAAIEINRKAQA
jgi:hypothetical protein